MLVPVQAAGQGWLLAGLGERIDAVGQDSRRAGHPDGRVISRWRARWQITPASAAWIALSDPGAFIMERRMLVGIKARTSGAPRGR